jgi:hypothetical protein
MALDIYTVDGFLYNYIELGTYLPENGPEEGNPEEFQSQIILTINRKGSFLQISRFFEKTIQWK